MAATDVSYDVYRVESAGMPRDHHAIFVQTNNDGSGHTFQVTGNIQTGMVYEDKPTERPEDLATYQGKLLIGTVTAANYDRIKEVCKGIPAPKKQFDGPRRLFPNEQLRRCQEWTKEAIDALLSAKVVDH